MADDKQLGSGVMIGSYRLTEQIGKGGFSTVWSAWDTRLNRLVAIKLMSMEAEDETGSAQFEREAGLIAQLQHPFIVPLYDFGKTADHRYLVMRYVIGGSLSQRLHQTPRLPITETLRLVTLIASALDYIHDQQIAHRDLKPANILLDAQGLPYLSDFGLAKSVHQRVMQHTIAGTLYYMPPEQYLGERLTTQADIYSLGILLYQLFAGALPHGGHASQGALQLRRGAEERLPDITLLQPSLPPALNDLLWQMTAIDPHDRPTSAQMVMQRLASIFAAQGAVSIEQEALTLLQGVNASSVNYRRLEAERILQRTLPVWQRGELPLSLTEFVLLHDYLQETPTLVNQTVGTLMLRSAFEYGQFIEAWWNTSDAYRQWLACDHAVGGSGEAASRALARLQQLVESNTQVSSPLPLVHLRQNLVEHVADRLLPPSTLTAPALDLLAVLLERPTAWPAQRVIVSGDEGLIDQQLAKVAMSDIPEAEQAATLIGRTRRTEAVALMAGQAGEFQQLMRVREAAGSLPNVTGVSTAKQWRLNFRLGVLQLLRRPLNSFLQYMTAAAGSVLGMGWLVLSIYPDTPSKTLNVIGLGLLFGVLIALGLWSARHIASQLRVVWFGWRLLLAILVGGWIVANVFILFNQTLYDEILDFWVALASGAMFVAGVAISVRWSRWLQMLAGVAGIMLALLIPWAGYLRYYDGQETWAIPAAPIVFAVEAVPDAMPTVLIAALLMTLGVVLGAQVFPYLVASRKRPALTMSSPPLLAAKADSITRVMPSGERLDEVVSLNSVPDATPPTKSLPPI